MATAFIPETNDELWRECASWLTRWEILRHDHKANWPDSKIADLASILRDGVLLCRLVNKIDPGCIDMKEVNLKPTMAQFLCLRNINLFLKTCKENFGISDCFEDTMLFDLTNFHKVLCTLSKLSLCPKALSSDIEGFSSQKLKTREEDVIYQSLKSVQPVHRGLEIIESDCGISHEEIYQDLLVVRSSIEQPQPLEKRDFVIKELLDTEKNYVDVLSKLKNSFMIPLCNLMRSEEHSVVFHKIKELYEIHSSFLHELTRTKTNPNVKLCSVFLQFREKFLIYGSYCANLTRATTLLQELCDQNEAFNQAVIKYEKEVNNGRFKLRDVLSVPMQRILKYHLFLEKLIENTDVNHDEYADLRKSREAMLDVAGYINESARDVEHLNVINNLQENIVEWDHDPYLKLSDYGKLIKDAELKIKAHDDQKTRNRYVFIFDKSILICKQLRGNQFAYRGILNIVEYHVEEIHNRPILNKDARWSYNFLLVKNERQMAYTIFVRSLELKEQIIKAINDALDNIQPKSLTLTTHNFQLNTFQTPVQCGYCYKYLKGLIFQGYVCIICKFSVHKDCIQFSGKCGVSTTRTNGFSNGINENDPLRDKLWYVGEMRRETAELKLAKRENGTFLVRIRPNMDKDTYALTLKTDNTVKHMKICSTNDGLGDSKKYYLSQSKFFSSIDELILNYQNCSLKENFDKLGDNAMLLYPYHQLKAVVLRNHTAQDRTQLNIQEGQVIHIIGKEGYRDGWWKGRTRNNEVGYLPVSLIRLEGQVRFD
ncbi:protein vav-like isoform X1 [Sitophilus oryzae]|uniref:Protein vav-like isoform X1 n=1 Tax=Sitophilus oryzae TaxID=7048 RepID=A0A6J2YKF7_SITOR|nr:protein vav-like isoform X1 [Sitophilus oryzae]XP_030764510.1 protein vav-like isoform X2 [Sitophilus oryzae]XP_030764511.1 protein vav-like isoform X1 [Sitophilus oryzae]